MLSLETATRGGSIAVSRGSEILASREGDPSVSHSNDLLSLISSVLEEQGIRLREIEAFAAAVGPGSFTGLRIGLATAKSFAATLARPCIGVPTLEAVARSAAVAASSKTLAMLPAGRGEVFAQLFSSDAEGIIAPLDQPRHLPPQALLDQLASAPASLIFAGEGAHQHASLIRERALASGLVYIENQEEAEQTSQYAERRIWRLAEARGTLAEAVAAGALERFMAGGDFSPAALHAIYVRPSDAELNRGL